MFHARYARANGIIVKLWKFDTAGQKRLPDVLDMTVEQALEFFSAHPKIAKKLQTLFDVGLGCVKLGQSLTGTAFRRRSTGCASSLQPEFARRDTGRTLYILDEPTTGLHVADVERLLAILERLCDSGSSVLVIEHNLDVIKTAVLSLISDLKAATAAAALWLAEHRSRLRLLRTATPVSISRRFINK